MCLTRFTSAIHTAWVAVRDVVCCCFPRFRVSNTVNENIRTTTVETIDETRPVPSGTVIDALKGDSGELTNTDDRKGTNPKCKSSSLTDFRETCIAAGYINEIIYSADDYHKMPRNVQRRYVNLIAMNKCSISQYALYTRINPQTNRARIFLDLPEHASTHKGNQEGIYEDLGAYGDEHIYENEDWLNQNNANEQSESKEELQVVNRRLQRTTLPIFSNLRAEDQQYIEDLSSKIDLSKITKSDMDAHLCEFETYGEYFYKQHKNDPDFEKLYPQFSRKMQGKNADSSISFV